MSEIAATEHAGDRGPAKDGREVRKRRLVTATLLFAAFVLQFAAPLLRDRVPLSDELFIDSMLIPVWTAAQLALLAGVLRLAGRWARSWTPVARITLAVIAALAVMVLQPFFVQALFFRGSITFNWNDPLAVALLWSVPAFLWAVPAGLLVAAWLRSGGAGGVMRSLAWAEVALAALNLPFILWLTHLWAVYVNIPAGTLAR